MLIILVWYLLPYLPSQTKSSPQEIENAASFTVHNSITDRYLFSVSVSIKGPQCGENCRQPLSRARDSLFLDKLQVHKWRCFQELRCGRHAGHLNKLVLVFVSCVRAATRSAGRLANVGTCRPQTHQMTVPKYPFGGLIPSGARRGHVKPQSY